MSRSARFFCFFCGSFLAFLHLGRHVRRELGRLLLEDGLILAQRHHLFLELGLLLLQEDKTVLGLRDFIGFEVCAFTSGELTAEQLFGFIDALDGSRGEHDHQTDRQERQRHADD